MESIARRALLEDVRAFVTVADIEEYAICIDPGYSAYVRQLTAVLHSGRGVDDVDWEVLFHALREEPTNADAKRFRRFRMFCAAIGMLRSLAGELISGHAMAICLVEDATASNTIIYSALAELVAELTRYEDEDVPVVILAMLLVGRIIGKTDEELAALEERVLDAAGIEMWNRHDLSRARWRAVIERHAPPLLGELLLGSL